MNRSNAVADEGSKGADFLQLAAADAPPGGLADWLSGQLRAAIGDGRLPVGSRLPATRLLAADLRVSRGVVTEAYQRLREEGVVDGRGRNGTVVVATAVAPTGALRRRSAPPPVFSTTPEAGVFEALRAAPATVDLNPGVPDLSAFPRAAWLRAERSVIGGVQASSLGYGDPRGAGPLRAAVAQWVARYRGIRVDAADVLIVGGVAQALGLIAQVLERRGHDAIAVEDPSSLGARQHLHYWRLATPPAAVDEHGVLVDDLRASGARAALLTPAHQFPVGVVLAPQRRRELADWATEFGAIVVEDDYDAEHRHDRPPVPSLQPMLPEHVVYCGSVSKLLAPALRIGWVVAPSQLRAELVAAKRYADLGSSTLPQLVLAELMASGELERQLRFVRRNHRRRRDAMVAAVRRELPAAVIHGAAAGLHLMVTLPDDGPADVDLAAAALARGVKVQPLSWHRQRPGPPGLVFGYGARTPTAIAEGVAAIGAAYRELAGR